MKLIYIIFLLPVSNGYTSSDLHERRMVNDRQATQQASIGNFSISDSCEQCSGGIEIILFTSTSNKNMKSHLNKIIIDSLISQGPDYGSYSIEDFESNRNFGENCIGIHTATLLNLNTPAILSLTAKSEGACGTSVSDYFPEYHVTIDLHRSEALSLEKVITERQWKNFEQFVLKYAKANKIDNVPYIEGDGEENKHDQRKIKYLPGLRSTFYVKEKVIGVYTLINDKNPIDGYRKGSTAQTVGNEYMKVEIPLSEIRKFIDPNTAISSLIPK